MDSDTIIPNSNIGSTEQIPSTIPSSSSEANNLFGFGESEFVSFQQVVGSEQAYKLAKRFQVVMPLSGGGMGEIFLAREVLSGRFVALKVMQQYALSNNQLVEQFVREAIITARLEHPHIIPVYDLGFLNNNQLYYTMQYIEGKSLSQLMSSLSLDDQLIILSDAAKAVDYAHEKNLWHRDLKPHNILVGKFGDTYVIDWGLVSVKPGCKYAFDLPRIAVENAAGSTTIITHGQAISEDQVVTTLAGYPTKGGQNLVGTPAYMSPEQCAGNVELMGVASDVWAFGVMLFEVLTKKHPIPNIATLSISQILVYVLEKEFPCPQDVGKEVPPMLNHLCRQMLNKNINARMPTLKDFISGIDNYLKQRTVYGVSSVSGDIVSLQEKVARLEQEKAILQGEHDRDRAKLDVLTQISALWSQYARL